MYMFPHSHVESILPLLMTPGEGFCFARGKWSYLQSGFESQISGGGALNTLSFQLTDFELLPHIIYALRMKASICRV